ncbi:carbon storage regulator [Pseudomonas sp. P154a]|uniref:carbon storage regulator n=1 Tax=Pseudomonas mucoides TaxID=2730424 RepID=UPI001891F9EB|nr:carbon storage regulator [Pseudomonas mucoides]MBF6037319.1 carbon storage regulator [Pseudomonas mucoides]
MLVFTRKINEEFRIDSIRVTVTGMQNGEITLAITAPKDVRIYREEVHGKIKTQERQNIIDRD